MAVHRSARPRLLLVLALAAVWGGCGLSSGEDFDPVAWRSIDPGTGPARVDMVDDLLRRHDLVGQSREEVVALLGEPEPTDYFAEYDLVLRLGEGARVSELHIVTD